MLMDFPLKCIFFTLFGFLSGSVMYSYIIPKMLKGIDVREKSPDHNPGGMNAIHAAGSGIGILCIILDVLKAFVPVYLAAGMAGINGFQLVPVVTAPVLGHAFSPLLNFRGGKAVSAVFGALLGLWPLSKIVLLLAAATIFFKFVAAARPDSFCVSLSILTACIAAFFLEPLPYIRAAFILAQSVVIYKVVKKPNEGEPSINFGHYTLRMENRKLKLRRL